MAGARVASGYHGPTAPDPSLNITKTTLTIQQAFEAHVRWKRPARPQALVQTPLSSPGRRGAGLNTLYLQFDGVTDDVYLRTRGKALLATKMKVIENCRATGMKIVFVPAIVEGLNNHRIGGHRVPSRTSIQSQESGFSQSRSPAASRNHELLAKRFTLPDPARCVGEQTGITKLHEDWFPLACVMPFS